MKLKKAHPISLDKNHKKFKLAVTGAGGFVGKALISYLKDSYTIIALSRSNSKQEVEQRKCDLFSLKETEAALNGIDCAIYLVHSMLPSAALTQGNFEDMDLICADNFARSCKINKVKHIIYLAGLIPETKELSRHLASRMEVEDVLRSSGATVTVLRAGLIIGQNGSSFRIVRNLVSRLPVMILPAWTHHETQPVALYDVIRWIAFSVNNKENTTIELGGRERLTYAQLLHKTARLMNKKIYTFSVPFFGVSISKLWVTLFGQAPFSLVSPLLESLKHTMVIKKYRNPPFQPTPLDDAIRDAVSGTYPAIKRRDHSKLVRSVQRIKHRSDASQIAEDYFLFLNSIPFIQAVKLHDTVTISLSGLKLIVLKKNILRSSKDRILYSIIDGILVSNQDTARFEFRTIMNSTMIMLQDYKPSLPWPFYLTFQAPVHFLIMKMFSRKMQS